MSSHSIPIDSEAAILTRILETDDQELTPEAARYLLSRKFTTGDEDRVDDLSAKARAGSLTEEESRELDRYLHVASLLAVMQSQARRRIQRSVSAKMQ